MKSTKFFAFISIVFLPTGCSNEKPKIKESGYALLDGRETKKEYVTTIEAGLGRLNYLCDINSTDYKLINNTIDGLLTHGDFDTLELSMAESVKHNADFTEYTFVLRDDPNMIWSTFENKPYKFNGETQYIKASDFVSSIKTTFSIFAGYNDYWKWSFILDNVSGAAEFYYYSYILNMQQIEWDNYEEETGYFSSLKTNDQKASYIQSQIKEKHPDVYRLCHYDENPVTGNIIASIASGDRLGIKADDKTRTVNYSFIHSIPEFPFLIANNYYYFLPVNEHFLTEIGRRFGTSEKSSILYCGPYVIESADEVKIVLSKNKSYIMRQDVKSSTYKNPKIDRVIFKYFDTQYDSNNLITQFENGNVDDFKIMKKSKELWRTYVTGEDHTGTAINPYNEYVDSHLSIGNPSVYTISFNLSQTDANTRKAIQLEDVRKALLKTIDSLSISDDENEDIIPNERAINTITPNDFVFDDDGNDYVEQYYLPKYAKKHNLSKEEAWEKIKPFQHSCREIDNSELNELYQNAKTAIDKKGDITLPIDITISQYYAFPSGFLDRLSTVFETFGNSYFRINEKSSNSSSTFVVSWWNNEYADPYCYFNKRDLGWCFTSTDEIDQIALVDNFKNIQMKNGVLQEPNCLFASFNNKIERASCINDDSSARLSLFAEAEIELIEDMYVTIPFVNYGNQWVLSMSRGVFLNEMKYNRAYSRFTNCWVLKEPLSREEKNQLRLEYNIKRENYYKNHGTINIY